MYIAEKRYTIINNVIMRYTCETCALLFAYFFSIKRSISDTKKRQFFSRHTKENAERRWTPPLVRSVSRFTRVVVAESVIFWRDEDDDTSNDDARFFFLRLYATCKKREKKKNDSFFVHAWGDAVSRRGDDLPVFVFLRPREKDEKRCDDDENNETILWRELFLLDEKYSDLVQRGRRRRAG